MTCSTCRRAVLLAWPVDGQDRAVCDACIRRALKEADRALMDRESKAAMERWRKLGFA